MMRNPYHSNFVPCVQKYHNGEIGLNQLCLDCKHLLIAYDMLVRLSIYTVNYFMIEEVLPIDAR